MRTRAILLIIILLLNIFAFILQGCCAKPDEYVSEFESVVSDISVPPNTSNTDIKYKIEYPYSFSDTINSLIKNELDNRLKECLEYTSDATIDLKYSIIHNTNSILCVLFEGQISAKNAAHPSAVAFPICVSLIEESVIYPKDSISIDSSLCQKFKKELSETKTNERFTEQEWSTIVDSIINSSNEEIITNITHNPNSLCFANNGIIIIYPVSHAVGDYIKVLVDYTWNTGDGNAR